MNGSIIAAGLHARPRGRGDSARQDWSPVAAGLVVDGLAGKVTLVMVTVGMFHEMFHEIEHMSESVKHFLSVSRVIVFLLII